MSPATRRLAAILSADVVGYSRLMAEDEEATVRMLSAYREQIGTLVREHRGRVVDSPGDNLLAEFPTATDGVSCALEVQRVLQARNAPLSPDRKMEFRVGIHLGEVRVEGDRIYGDGVNIAARLEGLAEAGGICISDMVKSQVEGKLPLRFEDLGEQSVKNIPKPVRAYRVNIDAAPTAPKAEPRARRKAALAAAAVLFAVLVGAALWRSFAPSNGDRAARPTGGLPTAIAVLPFVNMSGDPEQEYFADGMAEEIINGLTKVQGLRVAARTSAFAFKGKAEDIRTIGKQLDVGAVVEGSVRKAGDRVRITAQLVRVADGFHIWSDSYDRKLDDVFAIQDEIARATVAALKVRLASTAPLVKRPTGDLRAYEFYLSGRHFWNLRTEEGVRTAINYFERALQADPEYALAHVGFADSYLLLSNYGYETAEEALPQAEAAITRALTIDESVGEAHVSLAALRMLQWRWDDAESEFRRGLQLSPGYSTAHHWYSWFLGTLGRTEEARAEILRALKLDPLSPIINRALGQSYLWAGDYPRAIERLQKTLELNPNDPMVRRFLTRAFLEQGMAPEVFEGFRGQGSRPEVEAELRAAYQEGGDRAFRRKALELRIAETQEPCTDDSYGSALTFAFLGESDRMFQCLQEAVDQRRITYILVDPAFEPYRSDPRFTAILKQMGLED